LQVILESLEAKGILVTRVIRAPGFKALRVLLVRRAIRVLKAIRAALALRATRARESRAQLG